VDGRLGRLALRCAGAAAGLGGVALAAGLL